MPRSGPLLQLAMMGNGNPREVLTPKRQHLVFELLSHTSVVGLGRALGLSEQNVRLELEQLELSSFVVHRAGTYSPAFLVVTAGEAGRVKRLVKRTAELQVDLLRRCWQPLIELVPPPFSQSVTSQEMLFLFVGNGLLDQALLDALTREGQLMPMPLRSAASSSRYYLWLVEGPPDVLGHYGQRATALPWKGWYLITFGRYSVGPKDNLARASLERNVRDAFAQSASLPLEHLAQQFDLPMFDDQRLERWFQDVEPVADELVAIYRQQQPVLMELFKNLQIYKHLPDGFGEFMCWYDHLVYARTIDLLAKQKLLAVPSAFFTAALWQFAA